MTMFRIGQKVVCVRNFPVGQEVRYSTGARSNKIQIGSVYTIREVDTRAVHLHGVACVRLVEVVNDVQQTTVGPWERGYPATSFRPVVERGSETGMAILREILERESHQDRVSARAMLSSDKS